MDLERRRDDIDAYKGQKHLDGVTGLYRSGQIKDTVFDEMRYKVYISYT